MNGRDMVNHTGERSMQLEDLEDEGDASGTDRIGGK